MLRFTLFGFPVIIQGMFWLNAALMGGAISAQSQLEWLQVLTWVAAAFFSVMIHELGHALAMRNFGDRRVGIILFAFGGLAQGSQLRTRRESLIVSAAGPGLQILAGLVVGWAMSLWQAPPLWLYLLLANFTVISLFWALLNLVPVLPLDGGHLCRTLLGPGKQTQALKISLACAVALAVVSFMPGLWLGLQDGVLRLLQIDAHARVGGGLFTLIVFGMLAWNNWKQLQNEPQIPWMNAR
ncbi:metalloprotease [Prosthecobacter sp.]|uniref:metalloprotease n=1 Tax=Prosthecobacter sp. TaxID=1965333 RepID=UPI0037842146